MEYHELVSLLQTNYLSLGGLESMLDSFLDHEVYFDMVHENQRGAKFFAIPLFSSRSLIPCLDPHQYLRWDGVPLMLPYNSLDNYPLPDLGWRWLWDSWHVLMLNDVDDQGWRYRFMFQGRRWHGKYYFGDFVRRRTWIRMRHREKLWGETGLEIPLDACDELSVWRQPETTKTGKAEMSKAEMNQAERSEAETQKAEKLEAETLKAEASRAETSQAETSHAETSDPKETLLNAETSTPSQPHRNSLDEIPLHLPAQYYVEPDPHNDLASFCTAYTELEGNSDMTT